MKNDATLHDGKNQLRYSFQRESIMNPYKHTVSGIALGFIKGKRLKCYRYNNESGFAAFDVGEFGNEKENFESFSELIDKQIKKLKSVLTIFRFGATSEINQPQGSWFSIQKYQRPERSMERLNAASFQDAIYFHDCSSHFVAG